jgi:4-amino-4-deoxy-L-arabinose transferase-like glycosyltransferase
VPSALRQVSPVRWAVFLLLALAGYRFWFSTQIELVPDEAYYWLWSKHLAASYRDKGPAIAWTIAMGTKLFGDTVFGIRFFAVLLSTATGWLLFVLARRLYDDRTALWCLLMAVVMPVMAVGSILMTIDSLSVLFWALAAISFWNALHSGKTLDWLWLGLAIGAGFLAKFTNGVQLACIALFLLWSKEHRPLLFSTKMIVLGAAFLVSISPILWWNMQNGWVHAMALHSRSGVKDTFGIHPMELLEFIGQQFGVVSPLFMAGIVVASVALTWRQHADLRTRFLLSQFFPLYAIFLFFSLNKAGKSNWPVPALVTGIILCVVFWRDLVARRPGWRWGVGAAFAIAGFMTGILHDTDLLRLPPQLDPVGTAKGWPDFAAHVERARETHHANLLLGNHYSHASLMTFYLPDHPTTYLPPQEYGASQFTLWPGYRVTPETRALYITTGGHSPPKVLQQQFSKIKVVDDFWAQHHGRPTRQYLIYLCTGG